MPVKTGNINSKSERERENPSLDKQGVLKKPR
jgi:hypothetical protein